MDKPNQSDSQNKSVSDILKEIEQKAKDNHRRIYRGEPECYEQVSSGLYRVYGRKLGIKNLVDVFRKMQEVISKRAEEYLNITENFNILAQIQHYGGKTNLIDFTTDYLIALFFACDRSHGKKNGRVILLKRASTKDYTVREMPAIINRAASQKSVLVEPTNGFIDPDHYEEIEIPHNLKRDILIHLQKFHGISTKRVYDDIHGYIQSLEWDQSSYVEWLIGKEHEESDDYKEAIEAYTRAIGQKLDFFEGYKDRGRVHFVENNYDLALADYNMAIELNPDNVDFYYYRAGIHQKIGDSEKALEDYNTAINLSPDERPDYYHARGRVRFEREEFSLAFNDYDTAKSRKPENTIFKCDYHHAKGRLQFETGGTFRMILDDYNMAIELQPSIAMLYRDRGTLYLREGDNNKAINDFTEWIKLNPGADIDVLLNELEQYTQKCDVELPEHIKARLRQVRLEQS